MINLQSLGFTHLKNAEHVSFFTNVSVAIEKVGAESLNLTPSQWKAFTDAVATEQDIVNRAMGSIYTPEMKAMDDERDRLFRLIRLKLQAAVLASKESDVATYAATIDKHLLAKYGIDITTAPYQEESALLRGFLLDVKDRLPDAALELIGIADDVADLERTNDRFADQYNERLNEKSKTDSDTARKLRTATEEQYHLVTLHIEYKANTDGTEVGEKCAELVGIINEAIRDARQRLNARLGRGGTDEAENTEG